MNGILLVHRVEDEQKIRQAAEELGHRFIKPGMESAIKPPPAGQPGPKRT